MSAYCTPTEAGLDGMLAMVVGEAAKASPNEGATIQASHHAVFIDRDGVPVATCSCNLTAAANLGCALSMIPPGGAEAMIEERALSETANANFYEVMNIFSSLLMDDRSGHLRLSEVGAGAAPVTLEDGRSTSFTLDLDRYGKGGEIVFRHV